MRYGSRGVLFSKVIGLVGIVVLLAACSSTKSIVKPSPTPNNQQNQQILRAALTPGTSDIATLDPALAHDVYSVEPVTLIFSGLVTLDAQLQVVPWVAMQMPDVSSDGLTYTFHLRPNLTFTDGEPIDAAAFAYAINRTLSPCTGSPTAHYLFAIENAGIFHSETCNKDGTISVEKNQPTPIITTLIGTSLKVVDPQTLVITLAQPAAYFLTELSYPASFAVPQALITKYGTDWTNHLASTGFGGNLFKVTAWNHNGMLTLKKNTSFWGTQPRLHEIDFTIFKSDQAAYSDYLAGHLDWTDIPASQYQAAQSHSDARAANVLTTDYYGMSWTTPPFNDVRMRQAIAVALNKQQLVTSVLHDTAIPTNHIVPQGMPGYDPDLNGPDGTQAVTGNPALASTLEKAYVADTCHGNVSTCPAITLTISSGSQETNAEAQAALQMWHAAMPGYPIKITTLDFNTLLRQMAAHSVQFWAISWKAEYPDPQDFLSLQFLPMAQYNDGNVHLPDAAVLMQKADAEQDPLARIKDYQAAEQLLVTYVGWIPLEQPRAFYAVSNTVKNYAMTAQGLPSLGTWQQIYRM